MKRLMISVVFVLVCALCLCFASCDLFGESYDYDDAKMYTAGGGSFSSRINKLDIEWHSGRVVLAASDSVTAVTIYEEGGEQDEMMYHWLDGDELKIRQAESGTDYEDLGPKTLHVEVPASLKFLTVEIDTSSADVYAENLKSTELDIDTSSGKVFVGGDASDPGVVDIDTTGGDVSCAGVATRFEIDTVSGKVVAEEIVATELTIKTSTGDVRVAFPHNTEIVEPETSVLTSSGDVTFQFWQDTPHAVRYLTTSGTFTTQYAETVSEGGTHTFISDNLRAFVSTDKGNLTVQKIIAATGE